jgi:dTDP-glucose 4,6-dehydratase
MGELIIFITGGAGFNGSHVVRLFVNKYPEKHIITLDVLTYAGNQENLNDIDQAPNYRYERVDILDAAAVDALFDNYKPEWVIHLAAESHVDCPLKYQLAFVRANLLGTINLLNSFKSLLDILQGKRFYHISTNKVYGTIGAEGLFEETTAYDPNSPYSASKASSDQFVRSCGETYDIPFVVSNCSNNYGQNQFDEKLINLFIKYIVEGNPLPVNSDGQYTHGWLYVVDHTHSINLLYHKGKNADTYNIGGFNERTISTSLKFCARKWTRNWAAKGTCTKLIIFVKNRPGNDRRYAIDATKINQELVWKPSVTFEEGLTITIDWYLSNEAWLKNVTSGTYQSYYENISYKQGFIDAAQLKILAQPLLKSGYGNYLLKIL